jgi:hypothetical protein
MHASSLKMAIPTPLPPPPSLWRPALPTTATMNLQL